MYDAQTLIGRSAANGYWKLSDRSIRECLALLGPGTGTIIYPPGFSIAGWNVSPTELDLIIQWTTSLNNTIFNFTVNYGTVGASGPFPFQVVQATGVPAPTHGPFVLQSTTVFVTGLTGGTLYYFQVIAKNQLGTSGSPVYASQSTA